MSISSLGSKVVSAFQHKPPQIEKKALPTNPFQNPALRDSLSSRDSFETGGRSGSRGGASLSGDVFQSATQASGARAALDLLGGIGEKVTQFAEELGDLLSAGGPPEGELSADGPEGELSVDGPEDELSADGPEGELSADGPEGELSADGSEGELSADGSEN